MIILTSLFAAFKCRHFSIEFLFNNLFYIYIYAKIAFAIKSKVIRKLSLLLFISIESTSFKVLIIIIIEIFITLYLTNLIIFEIKNKKSHKFNLLTFNFVENVIFEIIIAISINLYLIKN